MGALLETKFHMPASQPGSVPRPRLIDRLHASLDDDACRLTLISAPAGYGKSTLAAEWLRALPEERARVAWLSLDVADNAPARFAGYWLAALQRAEASLGRRARALLDLPHPSLIAALDELINDLSALGPRARIVLALDDYHTVTHPDIHEAMAYCLDHQPPQLRLVILTRADPPLPLARLRARNQLAELRARDLRFTPDEAAHFFNQSLHLNLTPQAVDALEARAEGWAAGLRLAGLAMQHLSDPAAFIQTFRGSHRYVLDYLAEEVVRQQSEDMRRFLTATAALDRFNASLCDALTGRRDSREMLNQLEQANLFLIPLDDERNWYRYHHLFADYLRAGMSPAEQRGFLAGVARWHEANGLDFEAVRYALAAGEIDADFDLAADIMERAIQKTSAWSGGDIATLAGWLDALPRTVARRRPLLCAHASRALFLAGRIEQSERLLDLAEQAMQSDAAPDSALASALPSALSGLIALYRGAIAALRGDAAPAIDLTTRALRCLRPDDIHARARAADVLGLAHEMAGDLEQASRHYLQASDLAHDAGVLYLAINARCEAALAQMNLGRLHQAETLCQQALQLAETSNRSDARIPPAGWAWAVLAEIALERNDLPNARRYLTDALALSQQGGLTDDLRWELACLARLNQALGDWPGALAAIRQADAMTQAYRVPRLSALSAAQMARLLLAQGQSESARVWAESYQAARASQSPACLREFEEITLARVWLAQGDVARAQAVLTPVLQAARAGGRVRATIEALILLAQTEPARRDVAMDFLRQALALAAPEGFRRVFVDEGPGLAELLRQARHVAPAFVDELLSLAPASAATSVSGAAARSPLSAQELNVLALLAAGKSNAEIAAALFISHGTAKWHVHNILQKLEAGNRAQAIARAREMGLA